MKKGHYTTLNSCSRLVFSWWTKKWYMYNDVVEWLCVVYSPKCIPFSHFCLITRSSVWDPSLFISHIINRSLTGHGYPDYKGFLLSSTSLVNFWQIMTVPTTICPVWICVTITNRSTPRSPFQLIYKVSESEFHSLAALIYLYDIRPDMFPNGLVSWIRALRTQRCNMVYDVYW